ncbi:MAG: cupin domain-containing protein [Gemmatimonas sp.]|nr:cupin domain-containing protein [Gemmatimonas sp.]
MPELVWTLSAADPKNFVGNAHTRVVGSAGDEVDVKLYYVQFEPAARTNWHIHSGEQILVVTRGRCRYQREGEAVREATSGRSIRFAPGVRHWHGAADDVTTEHVAINIENEDTTWLEPVTDAVFAAE